MIRSGYWVSCRSLILVSVVLTSQAFGASDREQRETAFKKDVHDSYLKFRWAQVAPCSTALRLYKEIVDSSKVPDSLRAYSFEALGQYYYAIKDFNKASELFKSASKLTKSTYVRHLWALSLYRDGDNESARSVWHTLALENKTEYSLVSNFFAGVIYLKNGDFVAACSSFVKCGEPDIKKPLTIEALSARHFCAINLGQDEQARRYEEQLKQLGKAVPQIDWSSGVDAALVSSAQGIVAATKGDSGVPKEAFTVQVGAFGSMENAYALQKKLSTQFGKVTVATVTLDDKTYYRVRIGMFATREQAEKFVIDSVQIAGLGAKAVPQ